MFSTAQQEIIDSYVPTMVYNGYPYYIAYSHYNYGYYNTEPDLYFIFSKEKITANSAYQYVIPSDSLQVSYRSYNYSTNGTNTARVRTLSFTGTLNIDEFEHIYTNAEFTGTTIQPDILREGSQNNAIQTSSAVTVLCAFLLVFCFWKMWTIHR